MLENVDESLFCRPYVGIWALEPVVGRIIRVWDQAHILLWQSKLTPPKNPQRLWIKNTYSVLFLVRAAESWKKRGTMPESHKAERRRVQKSNRGA